MDKDFARDIYFINEQSDKPSFIYRDKKIIEVIEEIDISSAMSILDIGERNRLTERIEKHFNISEIVNTCYDLDEPENWWACPNYDLIIFSHVIEHLFNPLLCLEGIKRMMKPDAIMIIATPIKPHFIRWGKGHFHEMDDYRFKKLMDRAGLEILKWHKFSTYNWWNRKCYTGIRPFIRMFFKEQSVVIVKIKK